MRYFDSRVLILILIIQLNDNSVCVKGNFATSLNMDLYGEHKFSRPICDDNYRKRYMIEDDQQLSNDQLFPSSFEEFLPNDATSDDIFPQFDPDGSSEFITHDRDSDEFIEHNDNSDELISTSEIPWMKSYLSYRDQGARKKFDKNGRIIREAAAQDSNRVKNDIDDYKTILTLDEYLRKIKFSKSNWTLARSDDNANEPYYTMHDTFGQLSRVGSIENNASQILDYVNGWAKNACAKMRRIVGGWSLQSPEQLPYMVFVDTGCGGVIIGDNWVLTAAHCVDGRAPEYVYAGSLELLGGCMYKVIEVHVHPEFDARTLRYDLCLLKINPRFVYSPAIKPIRLSKNRARYRMCGVVAGWGAKTFQGALSVKLMVALIPVVARAKCERFELTRGQFCAGYEEGELDSCQGDSGGPFVVNNYVVGIVSYGFKCAEPKSPGVYTDTYHHRRWIAKISGIS